MRRAPGLRSALVALVLASAVACDRTRDVTIDFPGTSATDRPLLLYSSAQSSACKAYEPIVGTPSALVASPQWSASCEIELDAFLPYSGPVGRIFDLGKAADKAWVDAALTTGKASLPMPPMRIVKTTFWIVATGADVVTATDLADKQEIAADAAYATQGAGVHIERVTKMLLPSALTANCTRAAAIAANPAIYDATSLNIYYVEQYGSSSTSVAQNCYLRNHPEIMFVSWGNADSPTTVVAHEIGHALGLVLPSSEGGHTYLVSGFDDNNLMSAEGAIINISVGQLYAMNFSDRSWLAKAAGGVARTCQDSWYAGACPALTTFIPGWP